MPANDIDRRDESPLLRIAGAEAAETKALEAKGLETKAIETKSGGAGTSAEREAAGILRFPAPQPGVSDMAPEAVPETTPETTPETALGPITAPTTVLASLPAEAPIEAGTPMEILADILACDLDRFDADSDSAAGDRRNDPAACDGAFRSLLGLRAGRPHPGLFLQEPDVVRRHAVREGSGALEPWRQSWRSGRHDQ